MSAAYIQIFKRGLLSSTKPSVIYLLFNLRYKIIIKGNWRWGQKVRMGGKALV